MEMTERDLMQYERFHAARMEKMAYRLGVLAIISTFLIPVVLPFLLGSIAIVFASLSRGGSLEYSKKGKQAAFLGALAIGLNIAYIAYAVVTMHAMLSDPAGRQQVSDLMYRMYGLTLEEFLSQTGFSW